MFYAQSTSAVISGRRGDSLERPTDWERLREERETDRDTKRDGNTEREGGGGQKQTHSDRDEQRDIDGETGYRKRD